MMRIVTADGTNLVTGDLRADTALLVKVFDTDDPDPNTNVFAASIAYSARATYLFDTLRTDDYWGGLDGTGYNWRYQLKWSEFTASYTPKASHRYRIEFALDGSTTWGILYPQAKFELVPRSTV